MDGSKMDHVLLRVKDGLIIGGACVAMVTWFFGIANLPTIVKAHEQRLVKLEENQVRNDLVVSGIQKDLSYLTAGIDEIKKLLKEVVK
jgi:hypothetical protein